MRMVIALLALIEAFGSSASYACPMSERTNWLTTSRPVLSANAVLTSRFGMIFHPLLQEMKMHTGIDWAADIGTPVIAAAAGVVRKAERQGYHGNMILLDHGSGRQTLYAHLSGFEVSAGNCVEAGTLIARVGSTGLVSGPALHFEVIEDGTPVDPLEVPIKVQLWRTHAVPNKTNAISHGNRS